MKSIHILLVDNGFLVEYGSIKDYQPGVNSAKKIAADYNELQKVLSEAIETLTQKGRFIEPPLGAPMSLPGDRQW